MLYKYTKWLFKYLVTIGLEEFQSRPRLKLKIAFILAVQIKGWFNLNIVIKASFQ